MSDKCAESGKVGRSEVQRHIALPHVEAVGHGGEADERNAGDVSLFEEVDREILAVSDACRSICGDLDDAASSLRRFA